jgi:hypothetical protein
MAFFENISEAVFEDGLGSLLPAVLIGAGAVVAAPLILPSMFSGLRPVAKKLIKGGIIVADKAKEIFAEAGEEFGDVLAEARAELAAEAAAPKEKKETKGRRPAAKRRPRKAQPPARQEA